MFKSSRNEAFYIYNYQGEHANFKKKMQKKNRKKFEHRELPIEKRTSMKLRNKNHP